MYLVTGGRSSGGYNDYLSSTEILTRGGISWSYVGELPGAMRSMGGGVSIGNTIIVTGNITSQF